jgi:HEAT repeat protein
MKDISDSLTSLLEDLQSDDEFSHSQAAFTLAMYGEPAVKPLIGLLEHYSPDVRMRAAWALGVMGTAALPMLLELAEGNNQHLRIEAIRILGVIGEGRSIKQLLQGLTDPNPKVAARAARAIGKIGDPRAYHALLTALQHPVADVRFESCRALESLRIPEATSYLLELAERDNEHTSWGAAVAEVARRAANEVKNSESNLLDEEFERIARLIHRHEEQIAVG